MPVHSGRIVTRRLFRAPAAAPGPHTPAAARHAPVPWVAMYHSVGDCSDDPYRITVTPERLTRQLAWLRRRGLRGVWHARAARRPRAGARARHLVGLTFDDGYADFVEHALPLLRRYGCGATLFVLPGRLGGVNAWDPLGPRKPLLTAERHPVRRLRGRGDRLARADARRSHPGRRHAPARRGRRTARAPGGARRTRRSTASATRTARSTSAPSRTPYAKPGTRYACAIDPGRPDRPARPPRVCTSARTTQPGGSHLKHKLHRLRRRPVPGGL